MSIKELLEYAIKAEASDLHLSSGMPPLIRVDGDIKATDFASLENSDMEIIFEEMMTPDVKKVFQENWEVDFSFEIASMARFRVNAFHQARGLGAVFRIIPPHVLTLEELELPSVFKEIASYPRGLVLVTGPTGSGKSTTLAAMIDYINKNRSYHIITIEDPIEFVHQSLRSLINQREVQRDTKSFTAALRSALREDPNIILVGELRDLETIRLAMTAAETGHLVFATLHTSSANKTIDRLIDVFPGEEKSLMRSMLSESLQAVVAQKLVKRKAGKRIAALEVMICTPAIRNLIREDKVAQIYSAIQTGMSAGMYTLDQHLKMLVSKGLIDPEIAGEIAVDKHFL